MDIERNLVSLGHQVVDIAVVVVFAIPSLCSDFEVDFCRVNIQELQQMIVAEVAAGAVVAVEAGVDVAVGVIADSDLNEFASAFALSTAISKSEIVVAGVVAVVAAAVVAVDIADIVDADAENIVVVVGDSGVRIRAV